MGFLGWLFEPLSPSLKLLGREPEPLPRPCPVRHTLKDLGPYEQDDGILGIPKEPDIPRKFPEKVSPQAVGMAIEPDL